MTHVVVLRVHIDTHGHKKLVLDQEPATRGLKKIITGFDMQMFDLDGRVPQLFYQVSSHLQGEFGHVPRK